MITSRKGVAGGRIFCEVMRVRMSGGQNIRARVLEPGGSQQKKTLDQRDGGALECGGPGILSTGIRWGVSNLWSSDTFGDVRSHVCQSWKMFSRWARGIEAYGTTYYLLLTTDYYLLLTTGLGASSKLMVYICLVTMAKWRKVDAKLFISGSSKSRNCTANLRSMPSSAR